MPQEVINITVRHNETFFTISTARGLEGFRPINDKWSNQKEVLDSYFVESAIEEGKIKILSLLKNVALEPYRLLSELGHPDLPITKSYQNLCNMLTQQYSSRVIIFRERQNCFQVMKKEEVSVCLLCEGEKNWHCNFILGTLIIIFFK